MPRVGKPPAFPFLYPSEDRALLGPTEIPIAYRMLFGFLAREGMRVSEALGLAWRDLDLERGAVSLDRTKTDDARTWAMDPGVTAALALWRDLRRAKPEELVFGDASEDPERLAGHAPARPQERRSRPPRAPRGRDEPSAPSGPRPSGYVRHPEPRERSHRNVGGGPHGAPVESDDQPVPARRSICY